MPIHSPILQPSQKTHANTHGCKAIRLSALLVPRKKSGEQPAHLLLLLEIVILQMTITTSHIDTSIIRPELLQENLRKHLISTNKHPGKYIYECKFCENEQSRFQSNFAKDFKAHLISKHRDRFKMGTAVASYVSGIYDAQNDSVVTGKKTVCGERG